ncbi:hypothetical protein VTK56DRAFT_7887 [Thermocarpiscus australiensis]
MESPQPSGQEAAPKTGPRSAGRVRERVSYLYRWYSPSLGAGDDLLNLSHFVANRWVRVPRVDAGAVVRHPMRASTRVTGTFRRGSRPAFRSAAHIPPLTRLVLPRQSIGSVPVLRTVRRLELFCKETLLCSRSGRTCRNAPRRALVQETLRSSQERGQISQRGE